ncbi:hypothetical protein HQQ94_18880 [Shewanella sp. VB17]|uniref:lysozyme inhibitor LprI family protein n=1 Tax=Shewanella sp. VB17 TaxID=2739432 RepID=UPI0015655F70|nr:hypothetical protein [Shewanella sp. VB17]NRD75248.1 hypothetical protein [Shewanella sp. VB17]
MAHQFARYWFILSVFLLSQNVSSASFDCASVPMGSFEETVCSSAVLSRLDEELAQKYSSVKLAIKSAVNLPYDSNSQTQSALLKQTQIAWIRSVRLIGNDDSIERAYRHRIGDLETLIQAYSGTQFRIECAHTSCDESILKLVNQNIEAIYKKGDSNSRFYVPLVMHKLKCGERAENLQHCHSLVNRGAYRHSISDVDTILIDVEVIYPAQQYCQIWDVASINKCYGMLRDFWKNKIAEKTSQIKVAIDLARNCKTDEKYDYIVRLLKRMDNIESFNRSYAQYSDTYCLVVLNHEQGSPKFSGEECTADLANDHYRKLVNLYGEKSELDNMIKYCKNHSMLTL